MVIDPHDFNQVWGAFVLSVLGAAIVALGVVGLAYMCGFFGEESKK